MPKIFGKKGSKILRHTGEGQTPLIEIPKALQNRAKLNPHVKTVKNCRI